jgi:hypothetical protein
VAFDTLPQTRDELKHIIFNDHQTVYKYEEYDVDKEWSVDTITDILFNELKQLSDKEVAETIACGYVEAIDNRLEQKHGYWLHNCTEQRTDEEKDKRANHWNEYRADQLKFASEYFQQFVSKYGLQDKVFVSYTFADDTALGCALEHGDLFRRVKHIHVSHH